MLAGLLRAPPAAQPRGAAPPATSLRGQYFAGFSFGKLVLTRPNAQIDFNWTRDEQGRYFVSPGPGGAGEDILVRWTGWLYAPTHRPKPKPTTRLR